MQDAIDKINNGILIGAAMDNEEWVDGPDVVSVTEDATGEIFDNF